MYGIFCSNCPPEIRKSKTRGRKSEGHGHCRGSSDGSFVEPFPARGGNRPRVFRGFVSAHLFRLDTKVYPVSTHHQEHAIGGRVGGVSCRLVAFRSGQSVILPLSSGSALVSRPCATGLAVVSPTPHRTVRALLTHTALRSHYSRSSRKDSYPDIVNIHKYTGCRQWKFLEK
jgi:hypothetical protein